MPTFADVVAELYPVYEAKSRKTWIEFESVTRLHLLPFYGERSIGECASLWRHYCAFQRKKNASRKLWHDRKCLRLILGYAFDCDYILKIPRLPLDPIDKARRVGTVVTKEDIEKVCYHASRNVSDLIKLLYDTGMRFSEGRMLRLEWVDFERKRVRVPASATKTRYGRVYPLTERVEGLIKMRCGLRKTGYVFARPEDPGVCISESQRGFQRALKRSGVKFCLHDLRRAFISDRVKSGMPLEVVCKLTGTSPGVARDIYLQVSSDDWARSAVCV